MKKWVSLFIVALFIALLPVSFASATPNQSDALDQSLQQQEKLTQQQTDAVRRQQEATQRQKAENDRLGKTTDQLGKTVDENKKAVNDLKGLTKDQQDQLNAQWQLAEKQRQTEKIREENLGKVMSLIEYAVAALIVAALLLVIMFFARGKKTEKKESTTKLTEPLVNPSLRDLEIYATENNLSEVKMWVLLEKEDLYFPCNALMQDDGVKVKFGDGVIAGWKNRKTHAAELLNKRPELAKSYTK